MIRVEQARTVTLPAEAACEGAYLWISNEADAAEAITVNNDGAEAAETVVAKDECLFLWCDGTSWYYAGFCPPQNDRKDDQYFGCRNTYG